MYADDVILLSTTSTGLQNKIDILNKYCQDWCLDVNINKTKVLIFNKAGRLISHNFMFNDNSLECVNKYKYLGIYFCASGSFSYAQNELYKKALKAYFKLSKDFLSLHPSVKTSLHVFDHTIKPILLYGCEVWGMFNPFSSKFRNGIDSLDKIYNKLLAEKLHLKFCKFILGVHSKTTNIAALSELGRFPLYFNIIKSMIKYNDRLQKCETMFPLLHETFEETKNLKNMNKLSWHTSIDKIILKIKSSLTNNINENKITDKVLKLYFHKEWKILLDNHSDGKLSCYVTFKSHFGCEKYLNIIKNFDQRRHLTRLRLSAHQLSIEKGRYLGIPREDRVCTRCNSGEIEDEIHFLLSCNKLKTERINILSVINENCGNFNNLDKKNKFIWLMNNENIDILYEVCSFIKLHGKLCP